MSALQAAELAWSHDRRSATLLPHLPPVAAQLPMHNFFRPRVRFLLPKPFKVSDIQIFRRLTPIPAM
jgi:hypothetical protein